MAPEKLHGPNSLHRRLKNKRRLRLTARAVHHPNQKEIQMSRKAAKWLNEKVNREEGAKLNIEVIEETPVVDALAEAEARHQAEALDPASAPAWMRPAVHGQYQAPNADVALARLAGEEKEAQDKVDAAKASRKAIEDAAVAEQQRLEANAAAAQALPNRLKESLTKVQTFAP